MNLPHCGNLVGKASLLLDTEKRILPSQARVGKLKPHHLVKKHTYGLLQPGGNRMVEIHKPCCAQPLITWKPTGVPIFDKLASLGPGRTANITALQIICACLVCALMFRIFADIMISKSLPIEEEGKQDLKPLHALVSSIAPVISKMIPILSWFYCMTVGVSLLCTYEVTLRESLLKTVLDEALVIRAINMTAQFSQDIVDVIFIISFTWFAKNLKNRCCSYITNRLLEKSSIGLKRMLATASHAVDYILYIGAFLGGLHVFGFDVSPILASLGASSVVIGIAAREITENIAAAITLYTAPPFEEGNQVKLYSVEGLDTVAVVAEGKVKSIEPLRTILETARGTTLYVANSMVLKFMVENESQKPKLEHR